MSRNDLPREHDGPLLFPELVDLLDTLTGEQVVCLPWEPGRGGSRLEVAGVLRRIEDARSDIFAIGESAWLSLDDEGVRSAHLSTLDGNDFFTIKIELHNATILIGDHGLHGSDLSDPESPWNRRP
jgi:hypothetical protein